VFLELAKLLPRTHLRVILAGPDVPRHLDRVQSTFPASHMLRAVTPEPAGYHARHASWGTQSIRSMSESNESSATTRGGLEKQRHMQSRGSEAAGSLNLCFRRGMGHDLLPAFAAQHGHIDLVFGPNAGECNCRLTASC